jgi:hypothetical protein
MDLNSAAFIPSVLLREVLSNVSIRLPVQPVLVHA